MLIYIWKKSRCRVLLRTLSELCSSVSQHWVNKHKLKVKWSRTGPDGVIKPPNCKMFSCAGSRKWQQADRCCKSSVIKKRHTAAILQSEWGYDTVIELRLVFCPWSYSTMSLWIHTYMHTYKFNTLIFETIVRYQYLTILGLYFYFIG